MGWRRTVLEAGRGTEWAWEIEEDFVKEVTLSWEQKDKYKTLQGEKKTHIYISLRNAKHIIKKIMVLITRNFRITVVSHWEGNGVRLGRIHRYFWQLSWTQTCWRPGMTKHHAIYFYNNPVWYRPSLFYWGRNCTPEGLRDCFKVFHLVRGRIQSQT